MAGPQFRSKTHRKQDISKSMWMLNTCFPYLELPVSIFSAWAEISAFAGYFARGLFSRLKGFWPRLLDILCCDLMPHSQQFHEFWFEAPQKTQFLSFLEVTGTGIPARFAPIPACDCFNKMSYAARIVSFCNAHRIRLQVSATLHTLTPSNCNTCLCCQRVRKLPRFKIPPSGCFFLPEPLFRLGYSLRLKLWPE